MFWDKYERLHNKYRTPVFIVSFITFVLSRLAVFVYVDTHPEIMSQRFNHLKSVVDSIPVVKDDVKYSEYFEEGGGNSYFRNISLMMNQENYGKILDYFQANGWTVVHADAHKFRVKNKEFFLSITADPIEKNKWTIIVKFNELLVKILNPNIYSQYYN